MSPLGHHLLAAAFFLLQCLSATHWVVQYQVADDDTGEAVRLARVCIHDGDCRAVGTHTSRFGLSHGASWIRLITYCLGRGGGLRWVQLTVVASSMVAGLIAFLVVRRFVPGPAALLALVLSLQPTMATADFTRLANSNLLPLPLTLYYGSAAFCAASGSVVAAVLGSVALAMAMSFNLTCMLMAPFHVALVALCARRPPTAAIAAVVLVGTFALESRDAALDVARVLASVPAALALLGATAATGLLVSFRARLRSILQPLRRHLASLPERTRVCTVMEAAVAYVSVVLWSGSLVLGAVPGHYLAPIVFPLLFLVIDTADRLSKRAIVVLSGVGVASLIAFPFAPLGVPVANGLVLGFSAVVAGATVVRAVRWRTMPLRGRGRLAAAPALTYFLAGTALAGSLPDTVLVPRDRQAWPVEAAEKATTALYAAGYTFQELLALLQQHSPGTLDRMIGVLDPSFFHPPKPVADPGWSLLALIVDADVPARTTDVVWVLPISAARSAIVVRAPTYLDRTHLRTCYLPACGAEPVAEACTERDPNRPVSHLPPFFQIDRVDDRIPGEAFSFQPEGGEYCILFSSPLRTPGGRVPHIIRVSDQWPLRTRITRVSGVDVDGQLPGAEVLLTDQRQSTGTIEVEVSSDGVGPGADWLAEPPLVEVATPNDHLLEAFRNGRTSRW